ncbi:MAG: hypothetical protein PHC61_11710 [Chitinivibrionales bacterium]|nr:hypothetical protein [Chitinivibrionales bacterium]
MLRIFEIKLPLDHKNDCLPNAIAKALHVPLREIISWEIRRQAVDARKKSSIRLIYTVDATVSNERKLPGEKRGCRIIQSPDEAYHPVKPGKELLKGRPVIVGSGPAGLFAGLILAQAGYRPIILEQGKAVEERCRDVERFWQDGVLDENSNAQFGEGGAGTFSDGKLTTLINDTRCRKILDELVMAGAPEGILTSGKPHIGSDRLRLVVRGLRETIKLLGGDVRFLNRATGLRLRDAAVAGLEINWSDILECQVVVFAVGHSARDTFGMLHENGVVMAAKPFSIGVRIEHPQRLLNECRFGIFAGHERLGAADYKMAYHAPGGRSAYTFCMCPGGAVIAASSHRGGVVTNGMSLAARNGANGNAALLVNVGPEDFGDSHPLAGFAFQNRWENAAFLAGGQSYKAPAQLLVDFLASRPTQKFGEVAPTYRPGVVPANLDACLPRYVCDTLRLALPAFARQTPGFDLPEAVLTGVETRSSCPVRILRGENFQSSLGGLYPAGEGAGYAGGIMSASLDGIRVAEALIARFACP